MKNRLFTLCLVALVLGCSSGEHDPDDPADPSENPPTAATQQDESEADSVQDVRELFGDIELRAWPQLTETSIGEKLSVETVQEIIGVDYPVTAEKSDYSPEWKYSWASPDKKQRGSVSISVAMSGMPESQMMIQAKVRQGMVEQGTGEEVDLTKYGVIGVLRTAGNAGDLQICAKTKMIIINTKNMRGRSFDDEDVVKKAAADLAQALFEAHAP